MVFKEPFSKWPAALSHVYTYKSIRMVGDNCDCREKIRVLWLKTNTTVYPKQRRNLFTQPSALHEWFFSCCAPRTSADSLITGICICNGTCRVNIYKLQTSFGWNLSFFCDIAGDGEERTPKVGEPKDRQMTVTALSPEDNQYQQTVTSNGLLQIVSI